MPYPTNRHLNWFELAEFFANYCRVASGVSSRLENEPTRPRRRKKNFMRPWGSSICRFFRFCTILFHFCYFQFKALRLFVLRLRSQTNASTSSILSEKSPAWLTILTQIVCLESGSYPLNKHSNQMPITSRFLLPVLHFRCCTAFILHSI